MTEWEMVGQGREGGEGKVGQRKVVVIGVCRGERVEKGRAGGEYGRAGRLGRGLCGGGRGV